MVLTIYEQKIEHEFRLQKSHFKRTPSSIRHKTIKESIKN